MVYVNDTLYQIVDSQPNFADEKSSFNLLGKIENTVSSSEEPKENFQAKPLTSATGARAKGCLSLKHRLTFYLSSAYSKRTGRNRATYRWAA